MLGLFLIITCILASINAQTPSPAGTATSSAGTSTLLTIPEVSATLNGAKTFREKQCSTTTNWVRRTSTMR